MKWIKSIGSIINNWDIKEYLGKIDNSKNVWVLAKCPICPNIIKIRTRLIKTQKSCSECRKSKLRKGYNWRGIGDLPQEFFNTYFHSALARNLEFKITIEEVWELFLKQNSKCALTGRLLNLKKKNRTASIDRIDPKKGYIIDNVQWVHREINYFKKDLDNNYFMELCKEISNYNKND